jgi:hypothetical protein
VKTAAAIAAVEVDPFDSSTAPDHFEPAHTRQQVVGDDHPVDEVECRNSGRFYNSPAGGFAVDEARRTANSQIDHHLPEEPTD